MDNRYLFAGAVCGRSMIASAGLVNKQTDGHDHHKDDQVPHNAHAVAEYRGNHHKHTAAQRQDGQHKPLANA